MAAIYPDFLFRVEARKCKCCICGQTLKENSVATDCANCGAYVCAECVRAGLSDNHICNDDLLDVPVPASAKKPVTAALGLLRYYA